MALSALTQQLDQQTRLARNIFSKMGVVGVGISLGQLLAGQPWAVVFVAPAMATVGFGIPWGLRRRLNNGTHASIEAFKILMQTPKRNHESFARLSQSAEALRFFARSHAKRL